MREHVDYWSMQAESGKVLVFGPVADPEGDFGIAVIAAEAGENLSPLCGLDPAIRSKLGFPYKLHPILRFVLGSRVAT